MLLPLGEQFSIDPAAIAAELCRHPLSGVTHTGTAVNDGRRFSTGPQRNRRQCPRHTGMQITGTGLISGIVDKIKSVCQQFFKGGFVIHRDNFIPHKGLLNEPADKLN